MLQDKLIFNRDKSLSHQFYVPLEFKKILDLCELIELHFKEERNPEFYATELSVTLWVLNPLCKFYFGRTVYGLIMDRVLQEAKILLRFSLMSSKQIAFELGFSDPACFSRFFLRETGLRPGGFRMCIGI